jgi:hypothetical protein
VTDARHWIETTTDHHQRRLTAATVTAPLAVLFCREGEPSSIDFCSRRDRSIANPLLQPA